MLNHYHQPCCGERASAAKPLRQIQYALQTSRQRALPHSFRYFMGVLMTKLACHVCIQYILQLYIYILIIIHIIIRIYIYIWCHTKMTMKPSKACGCLGFLQRTSQHLRCRGKQIWPWGVLVERHGDEGDSWVKLDGWTMLNQQKLRISQDISRYSYIS